MRLAVIAVTAGIGVTSCGNSGEASEDSSRLQTTTPAATATPAPTSTPTPAPTPTHEGFVNDLDGICRRGNRVFSGYNRKYQEATNAGALDRAAAVRGEAFTETQNFQDDLAALTPPGEDRSAYERYLKASRRIRAAERRIIASLRDGDVAEVERIGAIQAEVRERRTEAALDLGSEECGT